MDYEYKSRYLLANEIFEYIAAKDICTIDELADSLAISKDSIIKTVDLLIMFGLLEYNNQTIGVSNAARVILD